MDIMPTPGEFYSKGNEWRIEYENGYGRIVLIHHIGGTRIEHIHLLEGLDDHRWCFYNRNLVAYVTEKERQKVARTRRPKPKWFHW